MSPSATDFHAPSKSQGSREPGSLPPSFPSSFLDLFLFVYSVAQAGLTLVAILLPHPASHGIIDMPSLLVIKKKKKQNSIFLLDRVSCNTGWPPDYCVAEDTLEFWVLLAPVEG